MTKNSLIKTLLNSGVIFNIQFDGEYIYGTFILPETLPLSCQSKSIDEMEDTVRRWLKICRG